jgi:hypothetical protein
VSSQHHLLLAALEQRGSTYETIGPSDQAFEITSCIEYIITSGRAMRYSVSVPGLVLVVGCGMPSSSIEPETSPAGRQVNKLVKAIIARDPRGLGQVLSRKLVAATQSQGGDTDATLLAAFEPQRAGLLAQFGRAGVVGEFVVEDLVPAEGGELVALLSIEGKTLERPFYLVKEDGEYRFAGVHPEREFFIGENLAHGPVRGQPNKYSWPNWRFGNRTAQMRSSLCGDTLMAAPDDACMGSSFTVQANGSAQFTCPSWQCTVFGATCTYVFCDPRPCHYQIIGWDGWWDVNGRWTCHY